MRTAAVPALALLMTGCFTTLGELRETAPVRSEVVAGDYRAVALCTFDGRVPKRVENANAFSRR